MADKRAYLVCRSEHEITRLLTIAIAFATKSEINLSEQAQLKELGRDISPEAVLDKIEDGSGD